MNHEHYAQFQTLPVDTAWIGLARQEDLPYFCTPLGAEVIGWDNGLHYCFIQGFDEMVFAVNPDTCCAYYVYPLAENFTDFLRLILAVKGTNTLQQIILWDKQTYTNFIHSPEEIAYASKKEVLDVLTAIETTFGLTPMPQPFEYVKRLQHDFAYEQILFSSEFYETTGRERP